MTREEFHLKKVKIDDVGTLSATYEVSMGHDEIAYLDKFVVESPRIAHEDLKSAIKALGEPLAKANDLFPHRKLPKMAAKVKKAADDLENVFKQLDQQVIESVTVTGVSLTGEGDSRSVVITGKRNITDMNGERYTGVAMNSPNIHFSADKFGFEKQLEQLVDKVHEEVWLYFEQRKSAQGELFGKGDEDAA